MKKKIVIIGSFRLKLRYKSCIEELINLTDKWSIHNIYKQINGKYTNQFLIMKELLFSVMITSVLLAFLRSNQY